MHINLVETLADLVAIPSVNPMGRDVTGPEYYEHRVTDYLESLFQNLQVPYHRQHVAPLRENIVARLDGDPRRSLIFEAHQDTVPVTGMTIDPWKPFIRDGRLYGRGACDIKGGMAAMLSAFARLAAERPAGMPTLFMVCTVNEEFGFSGARALPKLWRGSESPLSPLREEGPGVRGDEFESALNPPHPDHIPRSGGYGEVRFFFPRKPDMAIVAEPTELDVVTAHKGVVRWRCHTHGRASHSSQPHLGDSALFRMARVLEALEIYQHDVVEGLAEHALCGRPTISVGTINGGISVNTVPDHCTIEIDRRCVPGEKPREAYAHVLNYLRNCLAADPQVTHDEPFSESLGLDDSHSRELATRLCETARGVTGRCEIVGVPYGTDAATIADAGIPSVVFGPGSIAQAHTADEWIALDELHTASEIYYRFAREVSS